MTDETLFATALDLPDSAGRAAYLDSACPDPEQRRRVERLLAAHTDASGFLSQPALAPTDAPTQAFDAPDADPAGGATVAHGDGRADALAFLQPSQRPGSLGRLGHYEVQEVIGSGGFGTVLKAFDVRLHRVVAVKVLAPQLAASGAARARFLREGRSAAAVRDEHVVNVHAVSDDDAPVPYMVMEFVSGQTLQQKLDKVGPLPTKEVLRIGVQIARGLSAAHQTGLIHRDIKPANILLENGVERVKITDFGLARAADDASLSQSGVVAGTPMFMSPEQARGDQLDHRSDLFSLGSVLYALCAGRPPFRAETTLGVLKRVIEDDPRPVREVNAEVPRWLADVVARLLAKAPADRFRTAAEVADLLAGYLAEYQQRGTVTAAAGVAPRRQKGPWRWWWVPVLLVAVPVLLVVVALALPRLARTPDSTTGRLTIEVREPGVRVEIFATGKDETRRALRPDGAVGILFDERVPVGPWNVVAHRGPTDAPYHAKFELGPGGHTVVVPAFGGPPLAPQAVAPFGGVRATQLQTAWANYLGVPAESDGPVGLKLRVIPPGEFTMGSSAEEAEWLTTQAPDLKDAEGWLKGHVRAESPARRITIREPFLMAAHEVTVGQFREFVADTKHVTDAEKSGGGLAWDNDLRKGVRDPANVWSNPKFALGENFPVAFVTAADARAFCAWLTRKDGRTFALPTEEQWEYACRAGTETRWFWGDDPDAAKRFAWVMPFAGGLHPVGQKGANPWGLYDVCGNVGELVLTPQGAEFERGGRAGDSAWRARSAHRAPLRDADGAYVHRGFRVAVVGDLAPRAKR